MQSWGRFREIVSRRFDVRTPLFDETSVRAERHLGGLVGVGGAQPPDAAPEQRRNGGRVRLDALPRLRM